MGGGKRGYLWPGKGLSEVKNGAVDPEHGTSTGRSLHPYTKGLLILHLINIVCVPYFAMCLKHIFSSAS
jgi:hypothetical protein